MTKTYSFLKNPLINMIKDAQELQKQYPDTFEAPTKEELDQLTLGSTVKICDSTERFWVTIISIAGDLIKGQIDNYLVGNKPYNYGDKIIFEKRHIFQIRTEEEKEEMIKLLEPIIREYLQTQRNTK